MKSKTTHSVGFLGFDKIQLLDLVGPLEAFVIANQILGRDYYQPLIISEEATFTSESRIKVASDFQLHNHPQIDTLVIAGGSGARDVNISAKLKPWINRQFEQVQRMVTVCTGIFLVAEHDYLSHKKVVTHWGYAAQLQKDYPKLKVDFDRLYIQQGKFYSAAGILSGIDLALNLIEVDHSVDVASKVAQYLVTYLKRSGYQSQFSEPLKFQSSNNSHIQRINRRLMANYSENTSVAQLAKQVHISERHLNRLIKTHFHMSASKYIEHIKLEQSKIYLTTENRSIETVANRLGYTSADAFRRSFKRKYGIAPSSYQLRFQSQ